MPKWLSRRPQPPEKPVPSVPPPSAKTPPVKTPVSAEPSTSALPLEEAIAVQARLRQDLNELLKSRAAQGIRRFLVVPIGFVCDHTEVLFDIDIEARKTAAESGATLRRTESLNTAPPFIAMLESLVRDRL